MPDFVRLLTALGATDTQANSSGVYTAMPAGVEVLADDLNPPTTWVHVYEGDHFAYSGPIDARTMDFIDLCRRAGPVTVEFHVQLHRTGRHDTHTHIAGAITR
jgi:hypothetical protein